MQVAPDLSRITLPNYWYLLSEADKYRYSCLRVRLSNPAFRNPKNNKKTDSFADIMDTIKHFCIRNDKDDWRRCLVCGICWMPEGIAINTRQLRQLVFKCKSSINGSLHKMGFTVNLGRSEAATAVSLAIPILKDNTNELRQWTVRQCDNRLPSPISPPQPANPGLTHKVFEIPMINYPPRKPIMQPVLEQQQFVTPVFNPPPLNVFEINDDLLPSIDVGFDPDLMDW